MDTLTIHSEKGGVGKTTLAAHLAMAAVRAGRAVTVVDLDPRATLTGLLDVTHEPGYSTNAILAADERPTGWGKALRVPSPWAPNRLYVIPAERGLGNREEHPSPNAGANLAAAFEGLPTDLVIVDTPPRPGGPLVRAGLALPSARVVWAATPDQDGLDGVAHSWGTVERIRESANPSLAAVGIVVSRYDGRTLDARRCAGELITTYGPLVLAPAIPERVIVRSARAASEWAGHYPDGASIRDAVDALWDQLAVRLATPDTAEKLRTEVLARLQEGAAQ